MMTPNQIAAADILDIVFEGRNKAYGAYQLQKDYNLRLIRALSIVLSISIILISWSSFKNKPKIVSSTFSKFDTVTLIQPPRHDQPAPKPIEAPKPVAQIQYTRPLIIKDNLFVKDTLPPIDSIPNAVISTATIAGDKTESNSSPQNQPAVAAAEPVGTIQKPEIFEIAEHPAEFPGGIDAWRRYLERNVNYPEDAIEHEAEATIRVQFIVDTDGNISEVRALNNPGYGLAEEAMRIIRNGPRWKPAEQNGRRVIFRHVQGITFRLQ